MASTDDSPTGLGGWAISQQCFDWILENVASGSKVLEFGSGMGTEFLLEHFEMTSIEQDTFWMNGFSGSRYIFAPIENDWYSWEALKQGNLENDYVLIIVDGPTRFSTTERINEASETTRTGIEEYYLAHPEIFHDAYILFDDTNTEEITEVCEWFLTQGFEKVVEMSDGWKQFTVVRKENLIK